MKKIALLLMICCMVTACGKSEDVKVDEPVTPVETPSETVTEETEEVEDTEEEVTDDTNAEVTEDAEEEVTEAATIFPLPATIDMNALDNCTVAVAFEKGDAYVDDTGKMKLDVTVYTYDLYDMVDMAILTEGDTIVIGGEEVLVESIERLETGAVLINGGIDNGGYDFAHDDSGVYYEHGLSDVKSYYAIGEASIPVSPDFEFVDSSDLDIGEVTFYPGDFLADDAGIVYYFTPNNTSIVIEDGFVIGMTRVYTP